MFKKLKAWWNRHFEYKQVKVPFDKSKVYAEAIKMAVESITLDGYVMFLDDLRMPPLSMYEGNNLVLSRTSKNAIEAITSFGMPTFISFDHDLGGDDTAMKVVNFIVENVLDGKLIFPDNFTFIVHSANPIGAENIRSKMYNLIKHCKEK